MQKCGIQVVVYLVSHPCHVVFDLSEGLKAIILPHRLTRKNPGRNITIPTGVLVVIYSPWGRASLATG